jgi:hypothetical protein
VDCVTRRIAFFWRVKRGLVSAGVDPPHILMQCVCVIVYSLENMFGGTELLSGYLPHYSDPGC